MAASLLSRFSAYDFLVGAHVHKTKKGARTDRRAKFQQGRLRRVQSYVGNLVGLQGQRELPRERLPDKLCTPLQALGK